MCNRTDLKQKVISLIEHHYESTEEAKEKAYASLKEILSRLDCASTEELKELVKPLCLLTDLLEFL